MELFYESNGNFSNLKYSWDTNILFSELYEKKFDNASQE